MKKNERREKRARKRLGRKKCGGDRMIIQTRYAGHRVLTCHNPLKLQTDRREAKNNDRRTAHFTYKESYDHGRQVERQRKDWARKETEETSE